MSEPSQVSSFMEAVEKNPELREKVKGTLDHIQQVAKGAGYDFTHDEFRAHLRDRWGMNKAPNYDGGADTCFFA